MKIILLNPKIHNRSNFNCEEESLTNYLQKQASQDMKKNLAVCFVLLDDDDNEIKGYYTLTSDSLNKDDVPIKYIKQIPANYDVPVTLLGRLARDFSMRNKGAGEYLLLDALQRSYNISKKGIGSMAVIVDPIDKNAVNFYIRYGFILLPDSGKMFLSMKVLSKLFK